jgi:hypothetical protein
VETRTVGQRLNAAVAAADLDSVNNEIDNEIESLVDVKLAGGAKRPRQIDLDDLVALEASDNEIEVDPSRPTSSSLAIPTFTVDANGELNFPTPTVEIVKPQERREDAYDGAFSV